MSKGTDIVDGVKAGVAGVESVVPALAPFDPLIQRILDTVKGYVVAKGGNAEEIVKLFPSVEELRPLLHQDYVKLVDTWSRIK